MLKDNKIKMVTVVIPNIKGRAIVQNSDELYIVNSLGYWTGQELQLDLSGAIKVISLLYGIDQLFEGKFDEVVKFIKETW